MISAFGIFEKIFPILLVLEGAFVQYCFELIPLRRCFFLSINKKILTYVSNKIGKDIRDINKLAGIECDGPGKGYIRLIMFIMASQIATRFENGVQQII